MKNMSLTKQISLVGILAGMVMVTYLLKKTFPEMPQGGTLELHYVTLGVVAVIFRIIFGKAKGFVMALSLTTVVAIILLMVGQFSGIAWVETWQDRLTVGILDYFAPFLVISFLALLPTRWPVIFASIVGVYAIVFACHYIVGVTIWGVYAPEGQSAAIYSLIYNGPYMLLTTGVALVTLPIIVRNLSKPLKTIFTIN